MTQDADCSIFIVMLSVIMQNVIMPNACKNFYSQIAPWSLIYEQFITLFKIGHLVIHHTLKGF